MFFGVRATGRTELPLAPLATGSADAVLRLPAEPAFWSIDTPALYTLRASVRGDSTPTDAVDARIGFRTIRFDADEGFFLNDRPLKIQGVCAHQDHAGVGVAARIIRRPPNCWMPQIV